MRLHRLLRLAVVAVLAALVGACEPPLIVELASAHERLPTPAFVISEPSQPDGVPRYDSLSIVDKDGAVMWAVRVLPTHVGPGAPRVMYGEAPEGFEVVHAAQTLEHGHVYLVSVAGEGRGTLLFRVEGNGLLSQEMGSPLLAVAPTLLVFLR
ncbi:hypothetical protein [Myxococcus sp. Y35]|uniref:hypothetical protein n=1 Tax=Pseudomyxococcus flavus TaxID=3115648 RepID=UPI003CF50B30